MAQDNPIDMLFDLMNSRLDPKSSVCCSLGSSATFSDRGKIDIDVAKYLYLAKDAIGSGALLKEHANAQRAHAIVSANDESFALAVVASCQGSAQRFANGAAKDFAKPFTFEEKKPTEKKDALTDALNDVTANEPVNVLVACAVLRDGKDVLNVVSQLRRASPRNKIVGVWALVDAEDGGMATLAEAQLPLTRAFTKTDIQDHLKVHERQDEARKKLDAERAAAKAPKSETTEPPKAESKSEPRKPDGGKKK